MINWYEFMGLRFGCGGCYIIYRSQNMNWLLLRHSNTGQSERFLSSYRLADIGDISRTIARLFYSILIS